MQFNITRFGNLLKRDFITHKKALMYAMLSTVGFFLFFYIVGRLTRNDNATYNDYWKHIYLLFLFIAGILFTSLVFREFKSPAGRLQFLSLPASNLEKLGSRWLYSLILFPLFITLAVWFVSAISITNGPGLFASFGREESGWILLAFILAHATMFMYATWFNSLVAFKGTLVGFAATVVFAFLLIGVFVILFHDLFDGSLRAGPTRSVNMGAAGQQFFEFTVWPIVKFFLKFLLAPFLWIVSYFKMKEKEA